MGTAIYFAPPAALLVWRIMPRMARVSVPGVAYHVTQRGNNRQRVFFDDADRLLYLTLLAEESARHSAAGARGVVRLVGHTRQTGATITVVMNGDKKFTAGFMTKK